MGHNWSLGRQKKSGEYAVLQSGNYLFCHDTDGQRGVGLPIKNSLIPKIET